MFRGAKLWTQGDLPSFECIYGLCVIVAVFGEVLGNAVDVGAFSSFACSIDCTFGEILSVVFIPTAFFSVLSGEKLYLLR